MRFRYLFIMLALMQLLPWAVLLYSGGFQSGTVRFYVVEAFAVAACLLLWLFYRKVMRPIDTLSGGLDMLRAQDWNSSLIEVGQPEVDKIVGVFNEMLIRLKQQRIRYEERTHFLNLLIESAPIGVVILDFDGQEVVRNPAAIELGMSPYDLRDLGVGETRDYRTASGAVIRCSCRSFIDRGVEHRFYLAEDISGSVTAAERAAYEKVIRVMAHEVNNTMAGFSSALSTALPEIGDPDIRDVLKACWKRSGELSAFTARFAEVVKLPLPRLRRVNLQDVIVSERRFLESLAIPKGVAMEFKGLDSEPCEINADPEQLAQVIVNIVKNSVESIMSVDQATSDGHLSPTIHGKVTVAVSGPVLTITDNGAGISRDKASRIFTPFYTDKPHGQGIGLMLIREVLTAHSARFTLSTSPSDNLTRFTINFPVA